MRLGVKSAAVLLGTSSDSDFSVTALGTSRVLFHNFQLLLSGHGETCDVDDDADDVCV